MQFITKSILILALSVCCSAVVSVGYKTNYKEKSVLIIGEVSSTASSVQISNILRQLRVLKNLYTKLYNEMLPVIIGNRMKVSRRLDFSEATAACLYDVQSVQFLEFLKSKVSVTIESNHSIQKYFTIYQRPSLLITSSEEIPNEIELLLDDTILVDINEIFSESMEVSFNPRSYYPIMEYDDVYGTGQSFNSRLLNGPSNERSNKCNENCCTLS